MRLLGVAASSACIAVAAASAPALAQGLSANEMLKQLDGRWAQQDQPAACGGQALKITVSPDRSLASIENWPLGRTTSFQVGRVTSIYRRADTKVDEALILTARHASPPELLTLVGSDANRFTLSSAREPAAAPAVFLRCPAAS